MTKSETLTQNSMWVTKLAIAQQLVEEVLAETGDMQEGTNEGGWVKFSDSVDCIKVGVTHLILEQCDLESELDVNNK